MDNSNDHNQGLTPGTDNVNPWADYVWGQNGAYATNYTQATAQTHLENHTATILSFNNAPPSTDVNPIEIRYLSSATGTESDPPQQAEGFYGDMAYQANGHHQPLRQPVGGIMEWSLAEVEPARAFPNAGPSSLYGQPVAQAVHQQFQGTYLQYIPPAPLQTSHQEDVTRNFEVDRLAYLPQGTFDTYSDCSIGTQPWSYVNQPRTVPTHPEQGDGPPKNSLEDSWSTYNPRNDGRHLETLSPEHMEMINQLNPNCESVIGGVEDGESLAPESNPAAFYEDVNDVISGTFAVPENIAEAQYIPHRSTLNTYSAVQGPSDLLVGSSLATAIEFQCSIRAETPVQESRDDTHHQNTDSFVIIDHQLIPPPDASSFGDSSQPSSPSMMSVASSSAPTTVSCDECNVTFSGRHRKGNLGRHRRQKHKGKPDGSLLCGDSCCHRSFNRSDARLKHYRKHHKYLVQKVHKP